MNRDYIDLPRIHARAQIAADTANRESRTIEVVFSTGARVRRWDWWSGKTYYERLRMDEKAVDLSRLKGGAPVLDTHNSWNLEAVKGVVEDAWIDKSGEARARLRFADTPDVQDIWDKVTGGIIRNISVGYDVDEYHITENEDGTQEWEAVRWTPCEISLVPVPADPGAGVRARDPNTNLHRCALVRAGVTPEKERVMDEEDKKPESEKDDEKENKKNTATENEDEDEEESGKAASKTSAGESTEEDEEDPVKSERLRAAAIRLRGKSLNISEEAIDKFVADGVTLDDATARMFQMSEERSRAAGVGMGSGTAPAQRSGSVDATQPVEKQAEQEFERSADIRREFVTLKRYVAYRKAEATGRVRISSNK